MTPLSLMFHLSAPFTRYRVPVRIASIILGSLFFHIAGFAQIAIDRGLNQHIKRPDEWDCTRGRPSQDKFAVSGVKEGVEEALRTLKTCDTCKKLFDKDDPIELLNKLDRINAIVVTNSLPKNFKATGLRGQQEINEWEPAKWGLAVAKAIDILPPGASAKTLPMRAPCIFINPSELLVIDAKARYPENLKVVRAIVILHELAHAAGVIPQDGHPPMSEYQAYQQSGENNNCIMKNCTAPQFCQRGKPFPCWILSPFPP